MPTILHRLSAFPVYCNKDFIRGKRQQRDKSEKNKKEIKQYMVTPG